MRPNRAIVSSARRFAYSAWLTSPTISIAVPPPALMDAAVSAAVVGFTSATTTRAPSSANNRAEIRPRPWPAPVTIATLSCSRPMTIDLFVQV